MFDRYIPESYEIFTKNQVSMIWKYRNHTLQTNPRHHEEELQNTNIHKTSGVQSLK